MSRLSRNVVSLFSSHAIARVLNFCVLAYLARAISLADYGMLSLFVVLLGFFMAISDFGMDTISIREMAQGRITPTDYFRQVWWPRMGVTSVAVTVLALIAWLSDVPMRWPIAAVLLAGFMLSMAKFVRLPFYASEQITADARISIIEKTTLAGIALLLAFAGWGGDGYYIGLLISALLALVLSILEVKPPIPAIAQTDWRYFGTLFRSAIPVGLNLLFVMVYYRIDTILLAKFRGPEEVAFYNGAYLFVFGASLIASAFTQSSFPLISRLHATSSEELRAFVGKSFRLALVLAFPVALGLALNAPLLLHLAFGERFVPAAPVLAILVYQFVFMAATPVLGNVLRATGRQWDMALFTGIGAFVNVAINWWCIPRYGMMGAAVVTLVTEATVFVLCLYWVNKRSLRIPNNRVLLKWGLAVGASLACSYALKPLTGSVIASLVALLLYGVLAIMAACVQPDEVKVVTERLKAYRLRVTG